MQQNNNINNKTKATTTTKKQNTQLFLPLSFPPNILSHISVRVNPKHQDKFASCFGQDHMWKTWKPNDTSHQSLPCLLAGNTKLFFGYVFYTLQELAIIIGWSFASESGLVHSPYILITVAVAFVPYLWVFLWLPGFFLGQAKSGTDRGRAVTLCPHTCTTVHLLMITHCPVTS